MSNTDLWDRLGKTDPKHTKPFQRSGGFKGTAIKPMFSYRLMTEEFGPCGEGWGVHEPSFQVYPGAEGEVLVYCTVSVWYGPQPVRMVCGVGGDKVISKFSSGLKSDDEAFKKAFTDAITNALKMIGVGADVHMGLFDDSKYVNSVREEFVAEEANPSRDKFVAGCKIKIDAHAPGDPELLEWWNSDGQKRMRRDFDVTKPQLNELKSMVVARMGIKKATNDA